MLKSTRCFRSRTLLSMDLSFSCLLCVFSLCSFGLSACSSSKPEPEIHEVLTKDAASLDAPEGVLFDTARNFYFRGLFSVAKDSFESLKTGYPLGAYAEFAELKLADIQFVGREFETAGLMYENFLRDHPSSSAYPYAILRAARSYHLAQQGVGRDTTALSKSIGLYKRLEKDFPSSIYAEGASNYREEALELLAMHQQKILAFYQRTNNQNAYFARLIDFKARWAQHIPTEEAEQNDEPVLEERPLVTPLDRPTIRLARRNLPSMKASLALPPFVENGDEYQRSKERKPAGLGQGVLIAKGNFGGTVTKEGNLQARNTIRKIECKDGLALLHVDSSIIERFESEYDVKSRNFTSEQNEISFDLPGIELREGLKKNCFAENDLLISESGHVRLQSEKSLQVMSLQNPSRIALLLH